MLPTPPLRTDIVAVAGVEIKVRSLSRVEALRIAKCDGDMEQAENFILACGANITEEEALEWRSNVGPEVAGPVVDRICELSGLVEGAQKSG